MQEVWIVSRDINGKRMDHFLIWDKAYSYIKETFTDEDEILLVAVEDKCIYSSLFNDPITLDELMGFFA